MDHLARFHVLVVDDDHGCRDAMRELLEGAGYSVHTAPDGGVALELLDTLPRGRVLVILDLLMPLVDGFEFIRCVRQQRPDPVELPILVCSGDARSAARSLMLDVSEVLRKPVRSFELLDSVARHLDELPQALPH